MAPTKVNYEEVDPVSGGLHFLREQLACERLGVSVLECDAGWTGKPHDHSDDGQEEVYLLIDGEATVTVGGTSVEMESGDAVRIEPDERRQIENGSTDSTFVLVGAP